MTMRYKIGFLSFQLALALCFSFSCQTTFAMLCSNVLKPQEIVPQIETQMDRYFVTTKQFRNLIERNNDFKIDPTSKSYLHFIEKLQNSIREIASAVKMQTGLPEAISFSVVASPGDLVIKFNRSKTHILVHLQNYQNSREYNYYLDRDEVRVSREKFLRADEFFTAATAQLESEMKRISGISQCRNSKCLFFLKNKFPTAKPPNSYNALNRSEQNVIRKLFYLALQNIDSGLKWSNFSDQTGRLYTSRNYTKGGLQQYLSLRRLPPSQWKNYRAGPGGEFQVNISNEPFETIPWGSFKSVLVEDIIADYKKVKAALSSKKTSREILTEYLSSSGNQLSAEDLTFMRPTRIANTLVWFEQLQSFLLELNQNFNLDESISTQSQKSSRGTDLSSRDWTKLRSQLESEFQNEYLLKKAELIHAIRKLPNKEPQANFFIIDGIKVPFADFSMLPREIQDYLNLNRRFLLANASTKNKVPENIDGTRPLFRATFETEFAQLQRDGVYNISPDINFEPGRAFQVKYFRNQKYYSGHILEIQNVPTYLTVYSDTHGAGHPEIRLIFPVVVDQFAIEK